MLKVPKNQQILILLLYFDRPNMVRNALYSILLASRFYKNWILAVNDDASSVPAEPIVRDIMHEHMDKVKFYKLEMTPGEKIKAGGVMGACVNDIIKDNEADLGIMLCDDDALYPTYLKNLNKYFHNNPGITSCHSNVIPYNPLKETFYSAIRNHKLDMKFWLNAHKEPICAASKVDASQVAWRISCNKNKNAWFLSPCPKNHDHFFYEQLYRRCGPTHYSGFISQYKGWHTKQLSRVNFQWAASNGVKLDTDIYPKSLPTQDDPINQIINELPAL